MSIGSFLEITFENEYNTMEDQTMTTQILYSIDLPLTCII